MRAPLLVALAAFGLASPLAACRQDASVSDNGRVVVFQQQQEPDSLNRQLSDMMAAVDATMPINEGLTTIDDQLRVVPQLATEVPSLENGLLKPEGKGMVATWKLRRGVTWHDGQPFTAEDVKFTYDVTMHPNTHVTTRQGYDKISRIEILDPYTLRLHFSEIYAPHDQLFDNILPKHLLASYIADPKGDSINKAPYNRHPIGTGPYKFKEWISGDRITLVANEHYWGGKPKLDGITMRIVTDENAAFTLLKSGDLDIYQGASIGQYEALKKLRHVDVIAKPGLTWEHLDFNLARPVFQDLRVRRAIAHAINKSQISEKIYLGLFPPANSDLAPLSWAYNKNIENRYPYDPAKAKALLDEAGWKPGMDGVRVKDGKRLSIKISTTAGRKPREQTELMLRHYFKQVGIELAIDNYPGAIFFGPYPSGTLKGGHYDLGMSAWVAGPDPENYALWHSSQIPPKGQNNSHFVNAEMDRLQEDGTRVLKRADRAKIYHRSAEILAEDLPMIPLLYWADINPVNKRVLHFKPNPSKAGNLWNVAEWEIDDSAVARR